MIHTLTLNPALDMRMRYRNPQLGVLNRAESVALEPSGKGLNAARALHRQGVAVRAVLPLGGPFGGIVRELMSNFVVDIVTIAGATRCNVKVADSQSGSVSEFNAAGAALSAQEWTAVQAQLLEKVQAGDWVVLAGSLPPGLGSDTYALLNEKLNRLGAKVCIDAEGEILRKALAAKPFLVKPNRHELEGLLGRAVSSLEQVVEAAQQVQAMGATRVAVSLGAEGALYVSESQTVQVTAPKIQPFQTVGCGDALLAGTVAALSQGLAWAEVARLGVAWGTARALMESSEFPDVEHTRGVLERVNAIVL